MEELGICTAQTEALLNRIEAEGKTAVVVCSATAPLTITGVADTVRETSRQAIAELHGLGIRTIMLTGDNELTAAAIAKHVGIDEAKETCSRQTNLSCSGTASDVATSITSPVNCLANLTVLGMITV